MLCSLPMLILCATDVSLAGVQAEIVEGTAERIVVIANNGTGSGDILVRSNSGATAVPTTVLPHSSEKRSETQALPYPLVANLWPR